MKAGGATFISFFVILVLFYSFWASAAPTMQQREAHADRNDDGVVDRKERQIEKNWEHKQESKVNKWWENKADTNNDGIVDSSELASWKTIEKEHIDLNADGTVDAKEIRLSWKELKQRANTPLEKKYDYDSDGWLAPSEATQMLKDKYTLLQTNSQARVDTEIEGKYDTNNDGIIDAQEAGDLKEDLGI
ncbi:MAG: hypothetical protein PHQ96_01915 [Candidatus Omnitrophica bacterium]|nr:hypothetical protein [Candidatus Omnitrophota bacterium]